MTKAEKLRRLLASPGIKTMPCCFDALSAKLIEQAGFPLTFMSGFATAAARLALPDTGLISYGEMLDQGRNICEAVSIPVLGDGDTGYGNAMNVKRTVRGYARAGFAAIMIEDQLAPKRCGHTRGKDVVERGEALLRIRAAVDARDELRQNDEGDILILARTDARHTMGLDEALQRARDFAAIGADILFVEAPENRAEMERITREAPGIHMANIVEGGKTPPLTPRALEEIGYNFVAYPLTLLSAAIRAMNQAMNDLSAGRNAENILDFADLRRIVGFEDYYAEEERYHGGTPAGKKA